MEGALLVFAGACSGIIEGLVVQPFDMVKTRHQLNTSNNKGVFTTLYNLYREGGIRRWYRGMGAEFVGVVPKSSGMYASYEIVRKTLADTYGYGDTTTVATIAGFASGFPESIIVTPTQVVKVRVQAKEHLGRYNNSIDCLQKIIKSEGISVLYVGLGPTIWRNCVWNTVYFGLMHGIKQRLPKATSTTMDLAMTSISGFTGGVIATCFNIPFDVVKSRFQSQLRENNSPLKYRYTLQSLYLIAKEEGLTSCYKGLNAKIYKTGIGGAVAMELKETFQVYYLNYGLNS
eukprot:gene7707-15774_t